MRIGVTGSAGFIGMHLTEKLLQAGNEVVSVDFMNPAYQTNLAELRSDYLWSKYNHKILNLDISENIEDLLPIFEGCEVVFHLAAWPGVRMSSNFPEKYFRNNVIAHANMTSVANQLRIGRFFYASSSSIYGNLGLSGPVSDKLPFQNEARSYYAATKIVNEVNANHFPFHPTVHPIALRFFTVFGPWGRPDMAYWNFTKKMLMDEPIILYGQTGGRRNFTYVDDAVTILLKLLEVEMPQEVRTLNIANSQPLETIDMLRSLGTALSVKDFKVEIVSRPKEDAEVTWADVSTLLELIGPTVATELDLGLSQFVNWYLAFHSKITYN
jgi:UDP-glucuronate 4-epimerase